LLEVDVALEKLATHPDLGWRRNFNHPELRNLRCWLIARPFHRHLIFYRHDQHTLDAVRLMHGARDLARRLTQPPGVAGD
jgi:plasmid stabilization system protein ParE